MMGCPISIGDHLYIDETAENWKEGLAFFIGKLTSIFDENSANVLDIRDIPSTNVALHATFEQQDFVKVDLIDGFEVALEGIKTSNEFLNRLRSDQRRYVKQRAVNQSDQFEVRILGAQDIDLLNTVYELYLNTKRRHLELNLFDCSKELFKEAFYSPNWEIVVISLRADSTNKPIGVALNYKNASKYNFVFAGLDYRFVESHNTYSQLLWQVILRGIENGCSRLDLGITTGQNKRKFGASTNSQVAYVQVKDDFNYKIISSMVIYDTSTREIAKLHEKRIATLESHFGVKKLTRIG